ncbi:hypothetical protein [Pseudonocardia alni]|uniref:hypothetical protein n=1 Tax=Pseudonocardia alni TaxID=33907 RepID=UPI00280A83B1|nr:hypothetical protein [Pseudonocardia alni]
MTALFWARKAARAAGETNQMQNAQIKALEKRQRQQDIDQHEAQARLIVIWFVYVENTDDIYVRLSNASALPVGQVVVTVSRADLNRRTVFDVPYLPPVENFSVEGLDVIFEQYVDGPPQIYIKDYPSDLLTVAFTDINGVRWTRDMRGKLTELVVDQ